jgi:hypothetical protein
MNAVIQRRLTPAWANIISAAIGAASSILVVFVTQHPVATEAARAEIARQLPVGTVIASAS